MSEANDIPTGGDNRPLQFANLNSLEVQGPADGVQIAQAATDQNQMQEFDLPNGAKLYMNGACNGDSAYIVDSNGTRHEFDQRSISFPSERNADGSVPRPGEIWRSRTFNQYNLGIERMPDGTNRVFYSTKRDGSDFRQIFGRPCLVG